MGKGNSLPVRRTHEKVRKIARILPYLRPQADHKLKATEAFEHASCFGAGDGCLYDQLDVGDIDSITRYCCPVYVHLQHRLAARLLNLDVSGAGHFAKDARGLSRLFPEGIQVIAKYLDHHVGPRSNSLNQLLRAKLDWLRKRIGLRGNARFKAFVHFRGQFFAARCGLPFRYRFQEHIRIAHVRPHRVRCNFGSADSADNGIRLGELAHDLLKCG